MVNISEIRFNQGVIIIAVEDMNLSSAFNRYLATPSVVHMLCEQKISSLLFDFSTIFITKSFSHHVAHCVKIQFLVQKFDFVKTHFFEWFEFSRQKNWKNNLEFSDKKLHFVSVCWVFFITVLKLNLLPWSRNHIY